MKIIYLTLKVGRQHFKFRQKEMKKNTHFIVLLFLSFILASFISSCDTEDIPDESMYTNVSRSIVSCTRDIHNQNIAGKPTGSHDMTIEGPLGGTIHITGTSSVDTEHELYTKDVIYDFQNVKYIYVSQYYTTEITIYGMVNIKGSQAKTGYISMHYSSDELHIKGIIYYIKNRKLIRDIDLNGEIAINETTSKTTAIICGNSVSY